MSTSSQPAPPVNHLESAIIGIAIVGPILSAIFVALRIYARWYLAGQWKADDWVAVLTLPFCIVYSTLLGISTHHGMGLHIQQMTPAIESQWFYWVLIASEFYVPSLFGYKLALLLLYNRLFGVYKWFRYTVYVTIFFVFGYLICNFITEWAGCSPIKKFWHPDIPGKCTNGTARDIAYGVCNIVSDFIIAILPLPMIWNLQLKRKEKMLLSLVFLSGAIALGMAILRSVYAFIDLNSYDRFGIAGRTFLISILEVNTGLVCACTPTLRPLFKIAKQRAGSIGSHISKKRSGSLPWALFRKNSKWSNEDAEKHAWGPGWADGNKMPDEQLRDNTEANRTINSETSSEQQHSPSPPRRQFGNNRYEGDSVVSGCTGMSKTTNVSFITTNDHDLSRG